MCGLICVSRFSGGFGNRLPSSRSGGGGRHRANCDTQTQLKSPQGRRGGALCQGVQPGLLPGRGLRPTASHRGHGKGGPGPSITRLCPETCPGAQAAPARLLWLWGLGMGLASPGCGLWSRWWFPPGLGLFGEVGLVYTITRTRRMAEGCAGQASALGWHSLAPQRVLPAPLLHPRARGMPGATLCPTASWVCGAGQGWTPLPAPCQALPRSAPGGGTKRGCAGRGAAARGLL